MGLVLDTLFSVGKRSCNTLNRKLIRKEPRPGNLPVIDPRPSGLPVIDPIPNGLPVILRISYLSPAWYKAETAVLKQYVIHSGYSEGNLSKLEVLQIYLFFCFKYYLLLFMRRIQCDT